MAISFCRSAVDWAIEASNPSFTACGSPGTAAASFNFLMLSPRVSICSVSSSSPATTAGGGKAAWIAGTTLLKHWTQALPLWPGKDASKGSLAFRNEVLRPMLAFEAFCFEASLLLTPL